jgi:hypothetical protein
MTPLLGLLGVLIIGAFVCTILTALAPPKCPPYVPLLLLCVAVAVMAFPR